MADPILQSPKNPHFFKPLLPGFDSHINIPVKFFSLHIQGRTERKTVELRSDASETIWEVILEGQRLTAGWKEFTVAHDFRVGDVVIFRHDGDFVFHVSGFGPSFSEIQYVQSCNLDDEEKEENIRKSLSKKQAKKRNREVEAVSFSSDESCFVAHVTDSNLLNDSLYLRKNVGLLNEKSNKIVLMNRKGLKTWTLALKFKKSSRSFYMRGGWRIFCRDNELEPGDSVTFKLERTNTETPLLCFSTAISNNVISTRDNGKDKITETGESSRRASSSLSSSSLNKNRFVTLNVTPDSFKRSRILFPVKFTTVNRLETEGGKTITLLDKHGVAWPVKLIRVRDRTMRLASGLREFFKANGIKAYESFVLELVWEDKTSPPVLKFCSNKIGT